MARTQLQHAAIFLALYRFDDDDDNDDDDDDDDDEGRADNGPWRKMVLEIFGRFRPPGALSRPPGPFKNGSG